MVRYGIVNANQAQFVSGLTFLKQRYDQRRPASSKSIQARDNIGSRNFASGRQAPVLNERKHQLLPITVRCMLRVSSR